MPMDGPLCILPQLSWTASTRLLHAERLFFLRSVLFLLGCGSIKLWEDTDRVKKVWDRLWYLVLYYLLIILIYFFIAFSDLLIPLVTLVKCFNHTWTLWYIARLFSHLNSCDEVMADALFLFFHTVFRQEFFFGYILCGHGLNYWLEISVNVI